MCKLRKECSLFNPQWINWIDAEESKVLVCCECYYWFACEANQALVTVIPPDMASYFISSVNIQKQFEVASKRKNYEFLPVKNSDL